MNDFILNYAKVNDEYSHFVHYIGNVIVGIIYMNINIINVYDDIDNVNIDVYEVNIEFIIFNIDIAIINIDITIINDDRVKVIVDVDNITNKFYSERSDMVGLEYVGL